MVANANDTGSISLIFLVVRRSAAPVVSCSIGGKNGFSHNPVGCSTGMTVTATMTANWRDRDLT